MKKNRWNFHGRGIPCLKQMFRVMKLITFFLFLMFFQVSAGVFSQNNGRFSLKVEKESINNILNMIEEQTDYTFLYNSKNIDVERKTGINCESKSIEEVLNILFEGTNVKYRSFNGNYVLYTNDENFSVQSQQPQKVSGKVTDSTGAPLPGVTVVIKGTTQGIITDTDGSYILSKVPGDATLVFSFVGMKMQEIPVSGKSGIDVVMAEETVGIEEVVAVGYGTQKKETLTGSVVNVAGEELKKSPAPNVSSSLSGKLPGLIVNQRSGEPGRDDPSILIRGYGTFDSNTDDDIDNTSPLIIIDGVERSYMSRLNPDDIESVSVLKDASAAIYGARAANGVILITTKKGTLGKPVFSVRFNTAFQHPTKVPDMLDAATFAQVYNEGYWYRAGRPESDFTPYYSDEVIQKYRDGSDPVLYPNTDWIKEVMKPYSMQNRVSIQATGGTESIKYLLSFGTLTQNGDYRNNPTDYEQYSMRCNINADLSENLSVGANISAIITKKKYGTETTWVNFNNIIIASPTLVARYPNGLIGPGRLGENPLTLDQRGYDKTRETPISSTFTASYKVPFVKGLKIEGSFNYDMNNTFNKILKKPYYYYEYNSITGDYDLTQGTGQSTVELTDTYNKWTTMLYNYRFVYNRTFDKHHVGAMVGQEQQQDTWSYAMAYRKNFVSSAIAEINVGSTSSDDKNNGGSASKTARNNYFGRFNYEYSSKYLAEFVFRYDGSQNFPEGKRYGFFPAGSVGWRLSEEPFIKEAIPFADQLKLRFSFGQVGNDKVASYQYMQSYSFGSNYVFGTNDVSGIYANTMPNPNITWERSTKADLGLDASLWKGLLGMELTFWKENRSNILATRDLSIPSTLGFSDLPDENIAKVKNHGFELKLSHKNKVRDLIYSIEGNVSFARNKIVYMDETPLSEVYQNQTGHPVGASLYYKADGIFHTQEELEAYPHASGTEVGDIKIVDLNDDGDIDSDDSYRFDYTATPEVVFGLNTNFQYKNFDLSLFFQGQTKVYHRDGQFAALGTSDNDNGFVARAKNRWTVDNPNGTMPRADNYSYGTTTFFLYDATFVRLKTAELGYSLPKNIASKIKMNDVRVYVSGFNLFTWAKEIKWEDPELSGDALYYPQQRVLNIGINLKF